jgi:hypothetical protein
LKNKVVIDEKMKKELIEIIEDNLLALPGFTRSGEYDEATVIRKSVATNFDKRDWDRRDIPEFIATLQPSGLVLGAVEEIFREGRRKLRLEMLDGARCRCPRCGLGVRFEWGANKVA